MTESEFPGILQLRATPPVLRNLVSALAEEEAAWKPSEKRWSVLEVLGHLCHVELIGFRGRMERLIREENPHVAGYDPDVYAAQGLYGGRTVAGALDEFERVRQESLAFLSGLPIDLLRRPGVHQEIGPITVGQLLHEWPLHDLGHVRQAAELIRTVKYYPHIGPWQRFYTMNP
jgi:hypothetical protein